MPHHRQHATLKKRPIQSRFRIFVASASLLLFSPILFLGNSLLERSNNVGKGGAPSNRHHQTACSVDCAVASIVESMNLAVDPCVDFYEFSCGRFRGRRGPLDNEQLARSRVLAILQQNDKEASSSSLAKARRFYKACFDEMNSPSRNVKGNRMLRGIVDELGGLVLSSSANYLSRNWSIERLLVTFFRNFSQNYAFFRISVGRDEMNASRNVVQLYPDGLGIGHGTRNFYTNNLILEAYAEKLDNYAKLLVGPDNKVERQFVADTVDFQKKLAKFMPDELFVKTVSVSWLSAELPFIRWNDLVEGLAINQTSSSAKEQSVLLYSESYFRQLNGLIGEMLSNNKGKRTLQNYIVFQAVDQYAASAGEAFEKVYANFRDVLLGRGVIPSPWRRCLHETETEFALAISSTYIQQFFNEPGIKQKGFEIFENLTGIYRQKLLIETAWMHDDTRQMALTKLDRLKSTIGLPDWLLNSTEVDDIYSGLEVTDDYYQNRFSLYRFKINRTLSVLRKEPSKHRPIVGRPYSSGAYYDPKMNEVVIFAGALLPPFSYSDSDIPMALSYGALGSIIGHEIAHTFQATGSSYDASGNLRPWWDNETKQQFKATVANCLTEQYSNFHLDAQRTLGENFADNAGINIAYAAYIRGNFQSEARYWQESIIEQQKFSQFLLDPSRLFFIAFAQSWCHYETSESINYQILQNEHSPSRFRVNGALSNMPEFSTVFQCPPNSAMNRPKKCKIL